jgi:hypothetical protein
MLVEVPPSQPPPLDPEVEPDPELAPPPELEACPELDPAPSLVGPPLLPFELPLTPLPVPEDPAAPELPTLASPSITQMSLAQVRPALQVPFP